MPTTVTSRRLALVTAPLVTAVVVGAGVAASDLGAPTDQPAAARAEVSAAGAAARSAVAPEPAATEERVLGTSRSGGRVPLVDNRVPTVKGKLWTTEDLDLRLEPRERSKDAGLVEAGKRVGVTGVRERGYAQVVVDGEPRWVTAAYLTATKPEPEPEGLSDAPCPDGSSIEGGLQDAAVKVYRSVCAAFPELSSYGGQDGHGEHVNGEAIDFMVPSGDVGERVKDFLYANRAELDLFDIIWAQQIWTIERSGEGFRSMEDRGSATANHFDHVHIKIN